jgi:hypothetical protein
VRKLDIEKLLHWAYRDELPKTVIGGLTGWEKLIYLGTEVDESRQRDNHFPVALGAPHPDALQIEWRVRQLTDIQVPWSRLATDIMGHLEPYAETPPQLTFQTRTLVEMHARMGNRPIWDLGPVQLTRMVGKNGKPVVNGITAGNRYATGAHCPLQLDPPGREIAAARCEYLVWRHALGELAAESWSLAEYAPLPPAAAALPWHHNSEPTRRILHDIHPHKSERVRNSL